MHNSEWEVFFGDRPELGSCRDSIMIAYDLMCDCLDSGNKLLFCGNGGSQADAEHIVGELMKSFLKPRAIPEEVLGKLELQGERGKLLTEKLQGAIPAIALGTHGALASAVSNDIGGSYVFAQQILGLARTGDLLFALSTSGNSENIVNAVLTAKASGCKTVAMTGQSGGELRNLVDVCICVPADKTAFVQELHLPVYHRLCAALEARVW